MIGIAAADGAKDVQIRDLQAVAINIASVNYFLRFAVTASDPSPFGA